MDLKVNLYDIFKYLFNRSHDVDNIDKLQNEITVYCIFFVVVHLSTWINPINCWMKPYWLSPWIEYAEKICYIEGTRIASLNDPFPADIHEFNKMKKVDFYEWIPLTFTVIGLILHSSRALWTFANWYAYYNLTDYCNLAYVMRNVNEYPAYIKSITSVYYRNRNKCFFPFTYKHDLQPNTLTKIYFIYKMLNLLNICIAFIILNYFVGETTIDGFSLIKNLTSGIAWEETNSFPRETVCLFEVRDMGYYNKTTIKVHRLQCHLTHMNLIEKIYIVMWFWLLFLFFLQSFTIILWLKRLIFYKHFLKNLIKANTGVVRADTLFLFCKIFPSDACLLIYMLDINSGSKKASDILVSMFKDYQKCEIQSQNPT